MLDPLQGMPENLGVAYVLGGKCCMVPTRWWRGICPHSYPAVGPVRVRVVLSSEENRMSGRNHDRHSGNRGCGPAWQRLRLRFLKRGH
jgi:hypothetical protein